MRSKAEHFFIIKCEEKEETKDMNNLKTEELTLPEIREVYHTFMVSDFPRAELKPLSMIENALKKGIYQCFGAKGGDGIAAYAFFIKPERAGGSIFLVDYLAVRSELRGTGIGSWFLKDLNDSVLQGADLVLLEVENPDLSRDEKQRSSRERRLNFYLRNGLRETGVLGRVFGVDYKVLEIPVGRLHEPDEVRAAYAEFYKAMLAKPVYRRMIEIR